MLRQPRPLVPFTFPFMAQSYRDRILNTQAANLLALWALSETTGTNAANAQGVSARDGTYTNSPTLNSQTFTDGTPAPLFDGTNDFVNVYSASLAAAFNGAEGTIFAWARMSSAGVWTDGTLRGLMQLRADGSNLVQIRRSSTNNSLQFLYTAGGTALLRSNTSLGGSTDWFSLALTWSKAADQMIPYINGGAVNVPLGGLGTWAGSLASTTANVASNTTAANFWSGLVKYAAVWSIALTASEIASIGVV